MASREVFGVRGEQCPLSRWERAKLAGGILVLLAIGIAVGVVISGFLWWTSIVGKGKTVAAALGGEVEDAIGLLEGLVSLGVVVGTIVGLAWGLLQADARRNESAGPFAAGAALAGSTEPDLFGEPEG
jgi:hypothetical protein